MAAAMHSVVLVVGVEAVGERFQRRGRDAESCRLWTTMPPDAAATHTPHAPSVSATVALAEAPICRDLGAVALARLVPELEEHEFAPGQAVYCQGDEADGLYLVRSGTAEMTVRTPSGGQEVSVVGPPTCFGDVELLTVSRVWPMSSRARP
jgi:hypothetical protein